MLTLDRIRDEILDLMKSCEENPDRAESGIREIFYILMCADQPLYLIYTDSSPLISPAASDKKNLYLRLFSHEDVAKKYVDRTGTIYKEHTLLDILQIGRWAFLGGAYGFVLNEGDRWIRISIPEFLSLFFERIYGDASLCNSTFVETILFINEVRNNSLYHYGMSVGEEGEWNGEVQPGLLPPLTIDALFHVPTENLLVKKEDAPYSYSRETLHKALQLCSCEPGGATDAARTDYVNSSTGFASFANDGWKVENPEDLALSFVIVSPQESESNPPPADNPIAEIIPVATATPVHENAKKGFFSFVLDKIRKKPARAVSEQEIEPNDAPPVPDSPQEQEGDPESEQEPEKTQELVRESELSTDIEPEATSGIEEETRPVDESPQVDRPDNSSDQQVIKKTEPKAKKKFGKKSGWIAGAAILAIVLVIGGFFTMRHFQYKENLQDFRTYIAGQDYAKAYILYEDAKLGNDADAYLTDEVDGLVLKYANNEISAEELNASLKALSNFSSLSQEIEIAKLTASKLEESKNAYVIGKESTDIYERLNTWMQVVPLDAVNHAAVLQSVEDNETRYVDVLRADIEYYRTRSLEFASDRVDVLAYWYPKNEYVPALIKEFSSIQSIPLSYYPISISDIQIRQETNSYWTLYIHWSNLSVKTINSICFYVVPLGENGEAITCEDVQGEWKIFEARDPNQYEPGEEPSFDNYYWTGAFYGPDVRTAKLTAVNIVYRDGSSASYTSDIDLDSLKTK